MTDVLIIGGGVSALAAADRLTQLRTSWSLVEARDRIGGRIWSQGHGVELGAEFVHGRNSIIWEYLDRGSLRANPYPGKESIGRLYAYRGEIIAEDWFCTLVDRLVSDTEGYRGPEATVDKVIARLGRGLDPRVRFFATDRIARLEGADTSRLSAKSLGIERQLNTAGWDNFRIEGGYERLLAVFGLTGDVVLNTPVTRIEWGKGGIRALSGSREVAVAKRALVTVPLSVLKRGLIEFEPALPKQKLRAIAGLEMGHVTKVVLRFARPITPPFSYLSTDGLVRVWWRYELGEETVLVGYTGGQADADKLASLRDRAIVAGLLELKALFGEEVSEHYIGGQVVDWLDEPWIIGAYSYTPVRALHHREALAAPVRRTLFFAGEATSTNGHVGTVTGAIESGVKAVEQIIRTAR
jgi:monoamine oxidase